MITPGDVNDRKPLEYKNFVESCIKVQKTYDIQPSLF